MSSQPRNKEELIEKYGPLKLVRTALGWYLIHDRLQSALEEWVVMSQHEKDENTLTTAYFTNAFVPDLSTLRFNDAWEAGG